MTDPKRVQTLKEAINLTIGDRNKAYGSPEPNLRTFAHLVDTYLRALGWTGPQLDAVDGSIIMSQAKVSRIAANKQHYDNYTDGACYLAIAAECAETKTDSEHRWSRQRLIKTEKDDEASTESLDLSSMEEIHYSLLFCPDCTGRLREVDYLYHVKECDKCHKHFRYE